MVYIDYTRIEEIMLAVMTKPKKIRYRFREYRAIKEQEDDRRYSYEKIAEIIGSNKTTIAKIANSKEPYPNLDVLVKLCEFFDCSLSDFIVEE